MERPRLPLRGLGAARLARGGRGSAGRARWSAGLAGLIAAAVAFGATAHAAPFSASAKAGPSDVPATDVTTDDEDLPVPPIPPDLPQVQAAPTPDFDAAAPIAQSGKQTAGLRPDVFRAKSYNRGDGYVNGSGDHDEGRFKQGPAAGFKLAVPLQ